VTDLRDLLTELAETPAPPRAGTAFSADAAFTAGRRRARRHRRLQTALTAGLAVLLVGAGTGLGLASLPRPAATPADHGAGVTRADPRPGENGDRAVIQWIGAPDATHVYLAYRSCPTTPCAKTRFDLVGSDDGGRTWSTRASDIGILPTQVLPSGTLLGQDGVDGHIVSSVDGGRTWSTLVHRAGLAGAVPSDGGLLCWRPTGDDGTECSLFTVDARGEGLTPLARQPSNFVPRQVVAVIGWQVWVTGVDPVAGRPAVASSVDGGASWSVATFTDRPPCAAEFCPLPALTVNARGVAVALFHDRDGVADVYRSTGGAWTRLDASALGNNATWSYVAADGSHVVCVVATDSPVGFLAASRSAAGYSPLRLTGLPAPVSVVRLEPDGRYYTSLAQDRSQLARSIDGLTWSVVTPS
jgi:hypothetical protein